METYKVVLHISAECEADAEELLNEYTGNETDVNILKITKLGKEDYDEIEKKIEEIGLQETDLAEERIKLEEELTR